MLKRLIKLLILVALPLVVMVLQIGCQSVGKSSYLPYPDQGQTVQDAVEWLVNTFQNDDGGYAAFSSGANQEASTTSATLDAIIALAAGGYDPGQVFPGKAVTPIDYLASNLDQLTEFAAADGGQAGKVILALTAAALDARAFPSGNPEMVDFVATLNGLFEPTGAFGAVDPFKQSLAILGLSAVDEPVPQESIAFLESLQASDGSWDDGFGTASSSDATAMAIMALVAGGRTPADASLSSAIDFLATHQLPNGWEYGAGLGASANSTAVVIQALASLEEDFYSATSPWIRDGRTPLDMLLAYQDDSGAFQADFGQGPFDDYYATVQAIPAVAGCPLPMETQGSSGCLLTGE